MKKKITIIISLVLIGLLIVPKVINKVNSNTGLVEEENVISVEAVEAKVKTIVETTFLAGKAEANKTVNIIPSIPATVERIDVEVGDLVEENQSLFSLDTDSVEDQLKLAKIGLDTATASVEQAQLAISSAKDSVRLAEIAYEMAEANYTSSYDQYNFAKENVSKYEELYAAGMVSKTEYEQMKLQASPSTVTLLENQLEQAGQSLKQAKSGVTNGNLALKQANAGKEQAKISYEQAMEAVDNMNFEASISGIVTAITITEDVMAFNNGSAITIEDLDTIKITTNISEKIVSKVNKGDQVTVVIDALDNKSFQGKIASVSPSADPRSLLYKVIVEVSNKDHMIKPGMFASLQIELAKASNHVVVNGGALVYREEGVFVYTVVEGKPVFVQVEVGIDTGKEVEIKSGLKAGELYIIKGMEFITETTDLQVIRGDQ